jgi:hypothetical protein
MQEYTPNSQYVGARNLSVPWNRVDVGILLVFFWLAKEFPEFYVTWVFVILFKTALDLSLSWGISSQSTPSDSTY